MIYSSFSVFIVNLEVALAIIFGLVAFWIWLKLGSVGHLPYLTFFLTLFMIFLAGHHLLDVYLQDVSNIHVISETAEIFSVIFLLLAVWRMFSISGGFGRDSA